MDDAQIEQLKTRRTAILAELAALNDTKAGGKPNSALGGVQHVEYKDALYRELEIINRQLSAAEPFEHASLGVT